jgi:hypothetical protein
LLPAQLGRMSHADRKADKESRSGQSKKPSLKI